MEHHRRAKVSKMNAISSIGTPFELFCRERTHRRLIFVTCVDLVCSNVRKQTSSLDAVGSGALHKLFGDARMWRTMIALALGLSLGVAMPGQAQKSSDSKDNDVLKLQQQIEKI